MSVHFSELRLILVRQSNVFNDLVQRVETGPDLQTFRYFGARNNCSDNSLLISPRGKGPDTFPNVFHTRRPFLNVGGT